MLFGEYVLLVAFLAIIYSTIARVLQYKFTDRAAMKAFQAESKELSRKHKEASERKDQAQMDKIMKEQMALMPKMNKVMMGQFKTMFVVLIFFVGFISLVNFMDPTVQDDVTIDLRDDGTGCDEAAEDGTFSACFTPERSGTWVAHALWYNSDTVAGQNATAVAYDTATLDNVYLKAEGNPFPVYTDKTYYNAGEAMHIFAEAPGAHRLQARLDSTTRFFVDLPVTIPILNVQRIHEPYWWFILLTLITGLLISIGFNIYEKIHAGGEK